MKQWIKYFAVILVFVLMAEHFLEFSTVEVNASDIETVSEESSGEVSGEAEAENESEDETEANSSVDTEEQVENDESSQTAGETEMDESVENEPDDSTEPEVNEEAGTENVAETEDGAEMDETTETEEIEAPTDSSMVTGPEDNAGAVVAAETENETGIWYVTIHYNLNGASDDTGSFADVQCEPYAITGGYEDVIYTNTAEEIPQKTGYTFGGWLSDSGTIYDAGEYLEFNKDQYAGTTFNLTAIWKCVTVNYDYNGGNGENYSVSITNETVGDDKLFSVSLPGDKPQFTYHRFTGWLCDADSKLYEAGSTATGFNWDGHLDAAITFTAQWEELPKVNVSYINGNETFETATIQQENEDDSTFNLTLTGNKPTAAYQKFNGWISSTDNSLHGAGSTIENLEWSSYGRATITFTAQWSELPTTNIEFLRHDGKKVTETVQQYSESDTTFNVTVPVDDSEYSGYRFTGWLCDVDNALYGTDVKSLTLLWEKCASQTVTFTAQWELIPTVNINFVSSDGKTNTVTISQGSPDETNFVVELPEDETAIVGKRFAGWLCNVDNVVYADGEIPTFSWETYKDKNITFTAQWEELPKVTIKYMNGSEVLSTETIQQPGENATTFLLNVPEAVPVNDGYTLKGWLCDADGNIYEPGSAIRGLSWATYGDKVITITAQWVWDNYNIFEAKAYTLSTATPYCLGEGSWKVNSDGYTYTGGSVFYVSQAGDYTFKVN